MTASLIFSVRTGLKKDVTKSLRMQAQCGELKGPSQHGFDSKQWKNALARLPNPTADDEILLQAVEFFAEQFDGIRSQLSQTPAPAGTLDFQCRRAVGFVNREYIAVLSNAEPATIMEESNLAIAPVEHRVDLAGGVNSATVSDLVEGVVDALRFELTALSCDRNVKQSKQKADHGSDLDRIVRRGNLSLAYHMLEEQWIDCLYLGYEASVDSDKVDIRPEPEGTLPVDWAVGQHRDSALIMEMIGRSADLFANHPPPMRFKRIVQPKNRRRSLSVANVSEELQNELTRSVLLASEPELVGYFDQSLSTMNGATVRDVIYAWAMLAALAEEHVLKLKTHEWVFTLSDLERFCPSIRRMDLVRGLRQGTGLTKDQPSLVLNLLSWRGNRDSIWHRPLIPIPQTPNYLLVLPALRVPNLQRSVEYWLSEGSADMGLRGDAFEAHTRFEVADAVNRNQRLFEAFVNPDSIRPPDAGVGDIDLLLVVGNTILVGETKCLRRPGSSYERKQYGDRLREAVSQVKRKAKFVRDNLAWVKSVMAPKLNDRSLARGRVVECVVVNSAVGALRTVDDVPVVDLHIIDRYLRYGFASMFTTLDKEAEAQRLEFYSTEGEAESNLESYLRDPPHLTHYRKAVHVESFVQPDFSSLNRTVTVHNPIVSIETMLQRT